MTWGVFFLFSDARDPTVPNFSGLVTNVVKLKGMGKRKIGKYLARVAIIPKSSEQGGFCNTEVVTKHG